MRKYVSGLVAAAALAACMTAAPALAGSAEDLAAANAAVDRYDYAAAIPLYSNVLKAPGLTANDRISALMGRGLSYGETGDNTRALTDLNAVLQLDPKNVRALNERAGIYRVLNEPEKALADYKVAQAAAPDDTSIYANRARLLIEKGECDAALKDAEDAVRLSPTWPAAFLERASAHDCLKDREAGVRDWSEAIRILGAPDKGFDLWLGRARDYSQLGQLDLALADTNHVLGYRPRDVEALNLRALIQGAMGRYEPALGDAEQALGVLTPQDTGWPGVVGAQRDRMLFALGRYTEAAANFGAASGPYASRAVLWRHIAEARAGHDDTARFRADAARLKDTHWPMPVVRLLLGKATSPEVDKAAAEDDGYHACEAAFMLGQAALIRRDTAEAERRFSQASGTICAADAYQPMAKDELNRLKNGPATSASK